MNSGESLSSSYVVSDFDESAEDTEFINHDQDNDIENFHNYESQSAEEIIEEIITTRNPNHEPANPKILYPEAFNPDYAEDISPKCRKIVESFDKTDWFELFDAYDRNYKFGNDRLVGFLTKMLELKNRPHVVYETKTDKTGNTAGRYHTDSNTITFFLNPDGPRGDVGDFIRIISHEMWHAYQKQHGNDDDIARSELYDANARHYIRHQEDVDGYYAQLLEREAMWFGDHMKYAAERAALGGEDIVSGFIRRFKSFDQRHGLKS